MDPIIHQRIGDTTSTYCGKSTVDLLCAFGELVTCRTCRAARPQGPSLNAVKPVEIGRDTPMNRKYAALFIKSEDSIGYYQSGIGTWMIIYNDPNEGPNWYVHIADSGDMDTAKITVDALNAANN